MRSGRREINNGQPENFLKGSPVKREQTLGIGISFPEIVNYSVSAILDFFE